MAKRVELDISRCCACGACSIACMDQNDIDLKTGVRPFRTVFRQEFNLGKSIEYYSVACIVKMHLVLQPAHRVCFIRIKKPDLHCMTTPTALDATVVLWLAHSVHLPLAKTTK